MPSSMGASSASVPGSGTTAICAGNGATKAMSDRFESSRMMSDRLSAAMPPVLRERNTMPARAPVPSTPGRLSVSVPSVNEIRPPTLSMVPGKKMVEPPLDSRPPSATLMADSSLGSNDRSN